MRLALGTLFPLCTLAEDPGGEGPGGSGGREQQEGRINETLQVSQYLNLLKRDLKTGLSEMDVSNRRNGYPITECLPIRKAEENRKLWMISVTECSKRIMKNIYGNTRAPRDFWKRVDSRIEEIINLECVDLATKFKAGDVARIYVRHV